MTVGRKNSLLKEETSIRTRLRERQLSALTFWEVGARRREGEHKETGHHEKKKKNLTTCSSSIPV